MIQVVAREGSSMGSAYLLLSSWVLHYMRWLILESCKDTLIIWMCRLSDLLMARLPSNQVST